MNAESGRFFAAHPGIFQESPSDDRIDFGSIVKIKSQNLRLAEPKGNFHKPFPV